VQDGISCFTVGQPDAPPAANLAELRVAITEATDDGSPRAAAVIGDAHLIAYKLGYDVADLAEARTKLERTVAAEPLAVRRINLAVALLEQAVLPGRGERDASREDYRRGVELLEDAVTETPRDDPRWVDRATLLLSARLSAVNVALFGANVEAALAFGEEVVTEAQRSGRGNGEPENLLAGGLLMHAANGGDASALDGAVTLYRQAIATLADGHLDRPLRQSNLSGALLDRYELGGDRQDRDDALAAARTAFASIDERDPRRTAVANNLLNVLLVVARETADSDVLEDAFAVIPVLHRAYRDGDPLYATMLDNLANAAIEIYAATGRRDDLDAAVQFRQDAVRATEDGDPAVAWRVVLMAIDCSRQALDDRDLGVAEQGLRLGLTTLPRVKGEDDAARLASSLATIAYDLFLLSGRIDYLDLAARLHLTGLPLLADESPAVANLANNAGLALLDRFDRLGEVDDLVAAVGAHELAVRNTPPVHRDYAARRMNLATAYHRGYGRSGDPRELDRAEGEARAALAAARTAEIRAAARGTLIDVLHRRFTEGDARTYRQLRDYLDESAPESDRATESLRRAYVARDIGGDIDRLELLRDAITSGLRGRPGVALAAARELAGDGLALQVGGSTEGESVVADAVSAAGEALARMTADGERRHALSWSQDTYGLAAIAAQSRLLAGDATAAEAAFETGHARLLGQLRGAVPSDLVVRVWATAAGGGAVVGTGADARAVELPELTRSAVERWSRRLAIASRLGAGALEPVQTIPDEMSSLGIEPRRRFVEQQDLRPVDQRARDGEAAFHPARERVDTRVAAIAQLDELEQLRCPFADLRARKVEVATVDHQVVPHRQLGVDVVLLGHDPEARPDLDTPGRRILTKDREGP